MSGRFVSVDRDTAHLLPPWVQEWLPGDHLARFVVEIVEQLDLRELTRAYGGRGSEAFHPAMMVALLFYGCATGVFSSRKLEAATFDSVAMRYVATNQHPDHDTIADFRQRLRKEIKALFVQILGVARQHEHQVEPYIAAGRDAHYPPERLSAAVPGAADASAVEKIKHRLRTPEGREVYAARKCTVEPTFGIIKSVLGFRQFLLRCRRSVQAEWALM